MRRGHLNYLPEGVMEVSYLCEASDTDPTKILGAALAPDRALNTSIKNRLTEAPIVRHKLRQVSSIVTQCPDPRNYIAD